MSPVAVRCITIVDNRLCVVDQDDIRPCVHDYAYFELTDTPRSVSPDGKLMMRVAREPKGLVWRYGDGTTDRPLGFTHTHLDEDGVTELQTDGDNQILLGDAVRVIGGFRIPGTTIWQEELGKIARFHVYLP